MNIKHSTNNTQLVFTAHTLNLIYFVSFSWSLVFFSTFFSIVSFVVVILRPGLWLWRVHFRSVDVCTKSREAKQSSTRWTPFVWVEDETVRQRTNNLDQITINELNGDRRFCASFSLLLLFVVRQPFAVQFYGDNNVAMKISLEVKKKTKDILFFCAQVSSR